MRKLIAVLALASIAACGSDSPSSSSSFEGTWTLSTVNGAALPFTYYQTSTDKGEVMAETFVASAGKAYFTSTYRYTTTGQPVQTETYKDTADYSLNGNVVKIKYSASDSVMGTWSGKTLTASESGVTAVYVKQ